MKKIIIGLVGETGSGKDTFCKYVKKNVKEPVFCFRFSDFLSKIIRVFFDEVKKEDQQWLGIVLRQRFGNDILIKALLKKIKSIKGGIIILNGMRYWEEYKMIKNLGGKIIYITCDKKIRWQRVRKRGEKKDDLLSYKKFLEREKSKTETLISQIAKKADFKIENKGSRKKFYQEIKKITSKLK
ncbi:AAA family ATPase [Patescibacteria group bacterium]